MKLRNGKETKNTINKFVDDVKWFLFKIQLEKELKCKVKRITSLFLFLNKSTSTWMVYSNFRVAVMQKAIEFLADESLKPFHGFRKLLKKTVTNCVKTI